MNILTINLALSTLVFWVAAKLYVQGRAGDQPEDRQSDFATESKLNQFVMWRQRRAKLGARQRHAGASLARRRLDRAPTSTVGATKNMWWRPEYVANLQMVGAATCKQSPQPVAWHEGRAVVMATMLPQELRSAAQLCRIQPAQPLHLAQRQPFRHLSRQTLV
jgi:hypothetical protein